MVMNFSGETRYSTMFAWPSPSYGHSFPPAVGRVYGSATRPRRQRRRALSLPNRHSRQITGPDKRHRCKDGSLVSLNLVVISRHLHFQSGGQLTSPFHFFSSTLRPPSVIPPVFHPEYGRYMLESTPGAPYTGCVRDLLLVESNMRLRWVTARLPLARLCCDIEKLTRCPPPSPLKAPPGSLKSET